MTDITTDGPHAITDQRRWLARQLMDSRLSDKEAFGIVRWHPDISTSREEGLRELREALEPFANVALRFLPDEPPTDHRGVILHIPLGAAKQGRTGADLTVFCAEQLKVGDFRRAATALRRAGGGE